MTNELNLPPVLTRQDFDTEGEYEDYLTLEASDLPDMPTKDYEQRKAEIQAAARTTIERLRGAKRERITISVPENNLTRLKAQALRRGIPYQTYINEILHMAVRQPQS